MRVTNNTYVLSGSYYSAVNDASSLGDVYGIRTSQGVIIVDCGVPVEGPAILRETLAYFEVDEPVTHLIITHAHFDHCGGARELQDAGAKVIVGLEDAEYCINGGVERVDSPFYDEQIFPAFTPDITIDCDQALELNGLSFKFIKIPGHTPGSIAIQVKVDKKTIMFTGDALQPDGLMLENVSLGWQGDPDFNRQNVVDSMMKLVDYHADMVLPGHGKVCLRNGHNLFRLAAQTAFLTLR